MKSPIFVTGQRKSGTTMVKALLDGHPEIFMYPPNEFEIFDYSHHDAINAGMYSRERDPQKITESLITNSFVLRLANALEERDYYRPAIDVEGFQKEVRSRNIESYPDIIEACFESMAMHSSYFDGDIQNIRYAAKCVLMTEFLPELRNWFPDVKMVYVLRNPYGHFNAIRHSLRSRMSAFGFGAKRLGGVGVEGRKHNNLWHTYPVLGAEIKRMRLSYYFMRKWSEVYPENFRVLVYDRVLQNPKPEMEQLAKFLNIQYNESMLTPTHAGEVWGGNSWKVDNFEKIDQRPLTHWQADISKLEIRLINHFFGDVIEEYGFEKTESHEPLWKPFHMSERPMAYLLNRLIFKTPSWFGITSR